MAREPFDGVNWNDVRARKHYQMAQSRLCGWSRMVAVTVLQLVITLEQPVTWGSGSPGAHWVGAIVLELSAIAVLCAVNYLNTRYRSDAILSRANLWRLSEVCLIAIMAVDAVTAVITMSVSNGSRTSFRGSRVLRPLMLPLVSHRCARTVWGVLFTLRRLWDIYLTIVALCLLLGLVAVALFEGPDPQQPPGSWNGTAPGMNGNHSATEAVQTTFQSNPAG
eukprot:3669544-Prymnesium_polylepis.1